MKTRIISACVMLPLLILVYLGGYWLMGAAILVAAMGIHELYHGFEATGVKPCKPIGFASIAGLYAIHILAPENQTLLLFWMAVCVMACLLYGFNVEERKIEDMTSTLLGIMYVVFFSYHIVLIDQSVHRILIWLVFLAAFGTDVMAYFTGMALGKHKLCPKLSPKKSIEGAVGGTISSMVFCGLFGYFLVDGMLWQCAVIGLSGSIAAQLGDLSASAIKRQMGIKDYGNLIPGHGGILDRFDSVLFTAPFIYYTMQFVLY
ncbi:MAG: phosphatidate cytidylyltransferase [Firmicutes bacterium]|nr:phosphatidate cytidylyltransferase [Bacillota bacterium]